jgi:hypothetical protein
MLWLQLPTLAEKTECGTGLAYGKDHAYFITAPHGWLLDTESGASQGVYAVHTEHDSQDPFGRL